MVMLPGELRSKLRGPLAFPITPFDGHLAVDLDALRANVRALLQDKPAAIVAAGGTGELYSLAPAEHLAVIRAVVEESAGAVPVIAGVGFNTAIGRQLAADAARAGADGILAFPPYYPQADDEGLLAYYRTIAAATPLGMLIYSRDWFHPGAALVERLAAIETLIAWKDGQGDIRRLQILMNRVGDRLHWIGGAGDDMVPAYYAAGLRAYTSSVSNVSPRLALALHDYASAGDARLPRDHVGADRAALCASRAAARLRGQRDEGDDGHDGAGRRTGASAAHGRRRGDRRSVARPCGEVPGVAPNP